MGLHAARRLCVMSVKPLQGFFGFCHAASRRNERPLDHDDGQAQSAGGFDFRYGCIAARILGENDFNAVFAKQLDVAAGFERAASFDQRRIGKAERLRWGVYKPDDVTVPWSRQQFGKRKPSEPAEDSPGLGSNGCNCGAGIGDREPAVPVSRRPWRPLYRDQRNAGPGTRLDGVPAHLRGERVGRVHDNVDALSPEITAKAGNAAETTNSRRDWLLFRLSRAAGKRQDRFETRIVGQRRRKLARLAGPAQD